MRNASAAAIVLALVPQGGLAAALTDPPGSDRNINPTQSASYTEDPTRNFHGAAQPSFKFNSSSFRAQGISVGVSFRF